MDFVTIEWNEEVVRLRDHELEELDANSDFYAIFSAVRDGRSGWQSPYRLLYIGLAYHQTVEQRIKQVHKSYSMMALHERLPPERDTLVIEGRIVDSNVGRVTLPLCKDVEALLIRANQPKHNIKHKQTYRGRSLVIECAGGYAPLKRVVASSGKALRAWKTAS